MPLQQELFFSSNFSFLTFLFFLQSFQIGQKASSKFWDRQTSLDREDMADNTLAETHSDGINVAPSETLNFSRRHQTAANNSQSTNVCP